MISVSPYAIDYRIKILLNYFWFGFSLYSVAFVFPANTQFFVYLFQILQVVGIAFFIPPVFRLLRWNEVNTYLKIFIILSLVWNVTIISRGFNFKFDFIKRLLIYSNDGLFLYLVPLLLLFPLKIKYLKKVFLLIPIFGLFFIFSSMLRLDVLLNAATGSRNATGTVDVLVQCLALPCGYILMSYKCHSKRMNVYALLILLLSLYFLIVRARRGLTFITLSMIVVAYIMVLIYNKDKLFKLLISFLVLIILISSVTLLYKVQKKGFFGHLDSRMDEDTRTGVEQAFYNDMSTMDWIIGKGINGQYYCPGIDEGYRVTVYRSAIETGYLQIILRGGIISLVLFVLVALPASFMGLFKSRNMLCKAAGLWILLFMIYSYPMTIHWFILTNILIWISIGLCFNPAIRNMNDKDILLQLNHRCINK
jgi:hypothetical protein